MGLGKQFILLLWKNWTISRRKYCATGFEIALPIAFAFLILVIRLLASSTNYTESTIWTNFTVSDPTAVIPQGKDKILYSPNTAKVVEVMDKVQTAVGTSVNVTAYSSESDLLTFVDSNKASVWAAVMFDTSDDYSTALPKAITYSLRVAFVEDDTQWETAENYPFFQTSGIRNNDSSGGEPGYKDTGFLALQYAVDKAIIDVHDNTNDLTSKTVSLKKMAFPPFLEDNALPIVRGTLPLLLMLAYIVTVFQTTKNIVQEKENRIKESMKLMGLNTTIYWLSWFMKVFIYIFLTSLFFTLMFSIKIGDAAVLNNSMPLLTFLFILMYGTSIICFCFLMSAIFKTANGAAYAAGILYYLLYTPFFFFNTRYETMSRAAKMASCFSNNVAMSFGILTISLYEGTGDGAKFSNFYEPATVDDNFSLLNAMGMLVIDSLLCLLFAWYLENVRPGDFGVPRPLNFPFTRDYWCGPRPLADIADITGEPTDLETFEQEPADLTPGISISHLRKEFGSGKNKKVAVADTTLNFFEGQITVLLGHNGAGKTTTMSMLTGFIPPTKGTAIINGCDLNKDLAGVRKSLGLCPQHNILFDNLTVQEHLELFAKLKDVPSKEVKNVVDKMIETLKLEAKRGNLSHTLSGGQKRKLSVGIALIGDTKVVILDEPSSGMDPGARRETWDILQSYREGRTLVLTTHFMDEADHLGDRIAIMAEGVVKCCGTSHFLKKKYGAGYHLVIVKTPTCNVERLTSTIRQHIPTVTLESEISAELSYLLPFDESAKFEKLFTDIEQRSSDLGISSFGTSATTMEEVFLKVGENEPSEDDEEEEEENVSIIKGMDNPAFDKKNDKLESIPGPAFYSESDFGQSKLPPIPSSNGVEMKTMNPPKYSDNGKEYSPKIVKNTGITLAVQQYYGMFLKKAIHTWRNRVVTIIQLCLPVIFTILALLTESVAEKSSDEPALTLNLSPFKHTPVITYSAGKAASTATTTGLATKYKNLFSSYTTKDFDTLTYSTMDDFFVAETNSIGVSTFRNKYIIGAEFGTDSDYTAYFNEAPYHSPAISLAYMMTTLLQNYKDTTHSITTINHPLPLALSEQSESADVSGTGFSVAFFVLFGMAFLTTSFIIFLIREKQTGAKHLQKVSGVSSFSYWLSNYSWDFINYHIPVFLILIVFAAYQSEAYVYDNRLGIVYLLFFVYGLCCLPFVYCFHFLFNVPATGMTTVTMLNIITGLAALLTVFLLEAFGSTSAARAVDWMCTVLLPHYNLGAGLNKMYINYSNVKTCTADKYVAICAYATTLPCCSGCTSNCIDFQSNYLAWERPGVLKHVIFMLLQTVVLFALVLLVEYGYMEKLSYALCSPKPRATVHVANDEEHLLGDVTEDSDVKDERNRINETDEETLMKSDPLVIKNLHKTYGTYRAVKGISVGVKQQECFGLLGQNGAGKTSTFKMLTGDVLVTKGNAYLNSYDVKQHLRQVQQNIGYCPQFDALIDQMTGREILTMFARLRGVPEKQIREVVDNLIDVLMLKKYAEKNCATYSGGNKRKLSTAIALTGDPPFVLLDEPTTGMDPGARRKLWNVLSNIRESGRTLVLTSHSMEECDALCTKIVIMVNGKFVCLGGPQHLKNKFGHGYTLIMSLGTTSIGLPLSSEPVKKYIKEKFPDSEIFDDHQGYVHFQIPDANVPLAKVFSAMEHAKELFEIADYAVHQTTLEQVFLTFTRNQIMPEEKKKKTCCC